jgi:DNA-directed RNA polymerase specialized sigma24 family protein
VTGEGERAAEEARLARAAAAGDGSAFAALYERFERRCFNVAYRIVGAETDAAGAVQQGFLGAMRRLPEAAHSESGCRTLLFTATRDSCYDLLHERRGTPSSGAVPGDAIRVAAMRLPEHQREALALRELEELSFAEIATIMETSSSSVAQLISRAQINLHDELRGNVLASVAAPSPECERALPLIAAREDGQLEVASRDAAWLDTHLAGCERCGLGIEVMREAAASYRTWAPIAAPPGLLKVTMAKAAELTGADWSEQIGEATARARADRARGGADRAGAEPSHARPRRRRVTVAAGLAVLLLAGLAAAVLAGDDQPAPPIDAAARTAPRPSAKAREPDAKSGNAGKAKEGAAKKKKKTQAMAAETTSEDTIPAPASTAPVPTGGGDAQSDPAPRPSRPSGRTAVEPTQRTFAPKPSTKPKPAPTSTPAPQPAPAPAPAPEAEDPPPADESPGKSSGRAEPPGKPADRPPK